jgi:phosphatidate cytidylyltransferase
VFLPAWVYLAAVWAFSLLAAWELIVIVRRVQKQTPAIAPLVLLAVALPALWTLGIPSSGPLLAGIVLLLPIVYLLSGRPVEGAGCAIAGAVFAAVYFTVTGGAMGLLRTTFDGALGWKVVLAHCLVIWGGDSGAYYIGSRFGRHRLAPIVSPKKSWEGIGGGVALSFFAVWVCRTVFFPELEWPLGLALGALLSVLAPIGDLVESLFKRDAGVKDSSDTIPGHGGFLDRTDSLFFAAPFVLVLFILFGKAS